MNPFSEESESMEVVPMESTEVDKCCDETEETRGTLHSYIPVIFKPTCKVAFPRDNISYIAYFQPQHWHNLYRLWISDAPEIKVPCVLEMFSTDSIPQKGLPDHDEETAEITFTRTVNEKGSVKCVITLEGVVVVKDDFWFCQMVGSGSNVPTMVKIPWRRDTKWYGKEFNLEYTTNKVSKIDKSKLIEEPVKQIEVEPT